MENVIQKCREKTEHRVRWIIQIGLWAGRGEWVQVSLQILIMHIAKQVHLRGFCLCPKMARKC